VPPLSATSEATLYAALADWLQGRIASGALAPETRLPSIRRMSKQRGVSIATVVQAYRLLEDRGQIEARPQSGYYVRANAVAARTGDAPVPRMPPATPRPREVEISSLMSRVMAEARDPSLVPLGAGCPSGELYPHDKLARFLAAAARQDSLGLTHYRIAYTAPELAAQLARRASLDGYSLEPSEIIATHGCIEALQVALRTVTRPGDVVVVESPTYFTFLEILESLGLRTIEVPAHPVDGVSLEALEMALEQHPVKAFLLVANAQNPLGCTLTDEKKHRIAELCADYGVVIIEDEINADLHFGESRPKPIRAFSAGGDIVTCGSFSKTLAPGLRVGWLAGGRLTEKLRNTRSICSMSSPAVIQQGVAAFLASGGYDHHLRTIRRVYAGQLQRMSCAVLEHFPEGVRLSRPAGGFFLWVEMPAGVDAIRLHDDALAASISTAPGPAFSARARFKSCLRLNCAVAWSTRVEHAVATLGRLAREQLQ
jgi:DNA-binding transcriptional MocR family regulator